MLSQEYTDTTGSSAEDLHVDESAHAEEESAHTEEENAHTDAGNEHQHAGNSDDGGSRNDIDPINVITLRRTAIWSAPMPRAPTSPSESYLAHCTSHFSIEGTMIGFTGSVKGSALSLNLPCDFL